MSPPPPISLRAPAAALVRKAAPWLIARIDRLGPLGVAVLLIGSLIAVIIADFLLGADVSLAAFYLAPVAVAVWALGRAAGLVTAVGCALCWTVVARVADPSGIPLPWVWNLVSNALLFLLAATGLRAFRAAYVYERERAQTDPLTGVANRLAFVLRAEVELARMRRTGRSMSLAVLDIDGLKAVNDTLGHAAGDGAIRAVARDLTDGARAVDLVARMGGDEFAVLLPEADAADAAVAAARLQASASVACSMGCVTWDEPPGSVEAMLGEADALMYAAKRDGKGRVVHRAPDHRSATPAGGVPRVAAVGGGTPWPC